MRKYFLSIMLSAAALAAPLRATDCPFGLVNDREPGKCGLYQDDDRDSICDLSQAATPAGKATLPAAAPITAPARRPTPAPPSPGIAVPEAPVPDPPVPAPLPARPSPLRQRYPAWQVFAIVLALAVATELLCARNKRLVLPLQAAWNWALALSFLLTAGTGVVYAYPALLVRFSFNLGTWHSVPGLAMIAIGAYHTVRRFGCLWRGAGSWFSRRGGSCGG